jgi:phospholipase C
MRITCKVITALAASLLTAACSSNTAGLTTTSTPAVTAAGSVTAPATGAGSTAAAGVPRPDHVVVVVMENRSYSAIAGSPSAPYINSLRAGGASFTRSFAVAHPSEPNYLALFSGSTQGLTDDSCPHTYSEENLGHQLTSAGVTFKGYSESMPSAGYTGCKSGDYYRKHNPWVDFTSVPATDNVPLSQWPRDFTALPQVSFVVPNVCNDMHDCSVSVGDTWLKNHLGTYAQWAKTHNSLLVLTFDEDDHSQNNQIPTIFYGQRVRSGDVPEHVTHYTVLRTLEAAYGLACTANSCKAAAITDIWS